MSPTAHVYGVYPIIKKLLGVMGSDAGRTGDAYLPGAHRGAGARGSASTASDCNVVRNN